MERPRSLAPSAASSDALSPVATTEGSPTPSPRYEQHGDTLSSPREQQLEVQAPRMATTVFPSWDAFFAYFAVYQRQTYQVYMSKSSTSWSTRNQRILSEQNLSAEPTDAPLTGSDGAPPSARGRRDRYEYLDALVGPTRGPDARASDAYAPTARNRFNRPLPLVPEAVGVYAKTLICTHGGKPRSRSQGIRHRQHFRAMQCPAKVNLVIKKLPGRDLREASAWQVVVSRHVVTHNHPLDAETYMQYPQNRRVEDPHVLETVDALRRAGVKQRQIRDYLAERAPHKRFTRSDVHNLLIRMKQRTEAESGTTPGASTPPPTVGLPQTAAASTVAAPVTTMELGTLPVGATQRLGWTQASSLVGSQGASTAVDSAGSEDTTAPSLSTHAPESTHSSQETLTALTTAEVERSGSFRLRVDRLEEQNVALYEENVRLRGVNAAQAQQLQDAQALVAQLREQIARLTDGHVLSNSNEVGGDTSSQEEPLVDEPSG